MPKSSLCLTMQHDFFEKMERIDASIRQAQDIEMMMSDVLQTTLETLGADRAWLLFPCDPTAKSWRVPMERTRPEYSGTFALGQDIPMSVEMQQVYRESLQRTEVGITDYRKEGTAQKMAAQFSILTGMQSAIYPIVGKPWMFCVHQCSHYRDWTAEEAIFFRWIGSRLADGLGCLLFYQDLQEREHFVRDLLDATTEAILGVDLNGTFTFANPASVKLLGYKHVDELVGRQLNDTLFKCPSTPCCSNQQPETNPSQLLDKVFHSNNMSLWRADNRCFPVEYWSHPVYRKGSQTGAVITFWDITERQRSEQVILHQAHYDSLTNLPNRFLSLDRLAQLICEAERASDLIAVIFLDLDDFKKVNDTLGHDVGDTLLVEASHRLRHVVRTEDTVGRLGGDEFIIILSGLSNADDALPVVENLLNCFSTPFVIDGRELVVTATEGIAIYPQDGETSSMLLRNADSAMYHAKDAGRNTYSYYTQSMNLKVARRLALEEQMHGALERGEFEVFYQIQCNIETGQTIGAEALLRWFNPALGHLSPAEFIPIAEQTGMIIPLGNFVLEEALAKTAQWQKQGNPEFLISINLSARQFRDPRLLGFITEEINHSTVDAKYIVLEITESVLLSSRRTIKKILDAMRQLGLTIAMDDFGTGYSSLNYLREYPFDMLKIDRHFIKNIKTSPSDYKLINATISMAHALNLQVVAEGVETVDQFSMLKELGCDIGQGDLFGKPVAAGDVLV